MPTKDYAPGIGLVDDLQFLDDESAIPDGEGVMAYRDGAWTFVDGQGQFNPRSGFDHEDERSLTHNITLGNTCTITRDSGKVSSILWTVGALNYRKFEVLSRSSDKVATCRSTQYGADGATILRQLDVSITRSGGKVTAITTVRTI